MRFGLFSRAGRETKIGPTKQASQSAGIRDEVENNMASPIRLGSFEEREKQSWLLNNENVASS